MKNLLPLTVIILFTPGVLLSQDLDSLINPTTPDSQYVNQLNALALSHFNANPEKTLAFATKALSIADSLNFKKGIADAYFNLSLIFHLKGQYSKELDLHLKSLRLYEGFHDSVAMARTFNAMASVYQHEHDFISARDYLLKSLEINKTIKNNVGIALSLRKIGNLESDFKNYDQALRSYFLALDIEKKLGNTEGIANVLNNIGVVYYELGKLEEALPYYKQSLEIIIDINNLNRLPAAYHNLARVYLAQGKVDEALTLALKDLPLAQKMDLRPAIMEATKLLADIYERKNDYKKAFVYEQLYQQTKDSILNAENNLQYAQLKTIIETEQKQQEIELLKREQAFASVRQRITYAGLALAVLVGGLVIYALILNLRRKKLVIEKNLIIHQTQQALMESELQNKRLAEMQLRTDLEFRHKELLTYTLNLAQKNQLMETLRQSIQEVLESSESDSKVRLNKLIRLIDYSLETEKEWDEFRMYFEKVHSSFFENLKQHFPDLTQGDLKLCALISLNLSMKEMAELMGISPESVKMARHRLRKKLDIATEDNLVEFIAKFKNS